MCNTTELQNMSNECSTYQSSQHIYKVKTVSYRLQPSSYEMKRPYTDGRMSHSACSDASTETDHDNIRACTVCLVMY